jgi:Cof subfamily protein (haloacid dehalogenase superfamily)
VNRLIDTKSGEIMFEVAGEQIKLALFDVDGTLLGSSHTVSPRVREALHKLVARGVMVGLATGRALFAVQSFLSELPINGPTLTFSGAHIWDPERKVVHFSRSLSGDVVRSVLEIIRRDRSLHMELYTTEDYFVAEESPLIAVHCEYGLSRPSRASFESLLGNSGSPILKIECLGPAEGVRSVRDALQVSGIPVALGLAYGARHPDLAFLNITDVSANRTNALNALSEKTGLTPRETMAFGDAESDLPVLLWAGHGVAMGNAPEHVRNAVRFIAPSVDEDGIAAYLEGLGL